MVALFLEKKLYKNTLFCQRVFRTRFLPVMKSSRYRTIERDDGQWAVIREGAMRASSIHPTQKAALEEAARLSETIRSSQSQSEKTSPSPERKKQQYALKLGERLQRARKMRNLSLRSLAELLDSVSHTTLQKYEKGLAKLDTKTLGEIARALNLATSYFLKTKTLSTTNAEYRKVSSKLGKKARNLLEESAIDFFERYLEIESILGLPQTELPTKDLRDTSEDELPDAIEVWAGQMRKDWGLGTNPIANVHAMLEQNGIKVRILPHIDGFDGLSFTGKYGDKTVPAIAISDHCTANGKSPDLPRFRFNELHELGHLSMWLPENLEQRKIERCCHRFAGAFLFPRDSFWKVVGEKRSKITFEEWYAIKADWGMSIGAMMHRTCDLGVMTPSSYQRWAIWARKSGFAKKERQTWIGTETSNRFERLVMRAFSEEIVSASKAADLLQISYGELAAKQAKPE